MKFQTHPKWKYAAEDVPVPPPHKVQYRSDGKQGVIVQNEDEEEALGPGWYDSPALIPDAKCDSGVPVADAPAPKKRGRPRKDAS